jgi:Cu+-exporting ATPase
MAIDPICGMTVDEHSAVSAERDGQKYYFCCENCRQKFLEGDLPTGHHHNLVSLHVASPPALDSRPSSLDMTYTCPMHPEVEQNYPGNCPKCGMALEPKTATAEVTDDGELRDMTVRFRVAVALTAPVLLLAMLPMLGVPLDRWLSPNASHWLQLALSTIVVLWCGWPLLARGAQSIVTGHLNMFTLIALGVCAAYFYSAFAVVWPGALPASFQEHGHVPVYFEAAVAIVALVLLGQVLELRARRRTGSAVRELLSLAPQTARLINNGQEQIVSLEQVHVGDMLKVVPGDRVPVDGEIIVGRTTVDESMITGESLPVGKNPGDTVIGGTMNQTGAFEMRAMHVGADTMLAQIVQLVADAQRSRAPIQRLADVVAGWFVPFVVLVAVLTFIAWAIWSPLEPRLSYALVNAVAVLIIACPCALGLATPMSIMVAIGRGAKEGVLVKNAATLEVMERVNTLVVDKTGTLTEGKPRMTECVPAPPFSERDMMRFAAAVERSSEHPLGRAVVAAAEQQHIAPATAVDFVSTTGSGVQAQVDGKTVLVGSAEFLREQDIEITDSAIARAVELQGQGNTVIFVAVDHQFAGLLAITDPIKDSARKALDFLRNLGIEIVMLTGDNERTAQAVARQLGIEQVHAGVKPQDKQKRLTELRDRGRIVAMAGDGINDAPALAAADVGIAMGTGTDVAIESADIVLVKGDLRGIVRAFRLSGRTMRNIRQNLFFAFIYNFVGVPLAAGVLVPIFGMSALLNPMIAAAAMSFSSVSVIANALRLRAVKLGK